MSIVWLQHLPISMLCRQFVLLLSQKIYTHPIWPEYIISFRFTYFTQKTDLLLTSFPLHDMLRYPRENLLPLHETLPHHLHILHRKLLKATVILVPLLGFTWIIGLFAVGEEGRVFAYLFVLANVFQVRATLL